MVQINFAQKTVNVKIVFYGPGMSGKTTNLEVVHQRAPDTNHGELTSISTDGDRTLFFDYMPLDLGTVAGMRTCFQLYTVPGQVYYNSTRKLVLQGVDGVIFIADSSASMLDQNLESLRNLEENLNEYGKSLATMPHVLQWNKRDLPDAMASDEMNRLLNHHGAQTFEAVANTGQGVFPTLKSLAATVLKSIMQESGGKKQFAAPSPAPAMPGAPDAGAAPGAGLLDTDSSFPQPAAAGQSTSGMTGQPMHAHASRKAAPRATTMQASAPQHHQPQASPAPVMQKSPASAPPPAKRQRARQRAAATAPSGTAARRARKHATQAQVSAPKKKGGAFFTGAFVVIAAGVGAVLAWVVLTVL